MLGPTLAHLHDITKMSDSFALGGGPYHFFVVEALSAPLKLQRIDSAKSFFI